MKAINDSIKIAVAVKDSAAFLRSFSVSCSGFWDAENRGGSSYSLLETNGRGVDDSVCIALHCQLLSAVDAIRVSAGACALYRFVEEKASGFIAVVRQSWHQFRRRIRLGVHRKKTLFRRQLPERPFMLSYAGGLRL